MASRITNESGGRSIHEQLVWEEKCLRAHQRGVRISVIEEEDALRQALESSSSSSVPLGGGAAAPEKTLRVFEKKKSEEYDETYRDGEVELENDVASVYLDALTNQLYRANEALPDNTSLWHFLPQVVADRILLFILDPDTIGYLCVVSKTSPFHPREIVYKTMCERIYLRQTQRKKMDISRWGGCYRSMLLHRPRLRTNGIYSLRTMFTKPYSNDAFWQEKRTESVEVKFYRHLRFFDEGKVLYSLDVVDPWDAFRILKKGTKCKKVYEGKFTIAGCKVSCEIDCQYATMFFQLILANGCEGSDLGYIGSFNLLKLVEHRGKINGGMVDFTLPLNTDLRFHRNWSFL